MNADEIRNVQWRESVAADHPEIYRLPSVQVEIAAQLAELNATLQKGLIIQNGLKTQSIFEQVFGR